MWFVSGLVLIYHSFPNVQEKDIIKRKESLPLDLPSLNQLTARVSDSLPFSSLRIFQKQNQSLFEIRSKKQNYLFCADTLESVKPITSSFILQTARLWVESPIVRIDTLHQRDIWIMYSSYVEKLPIYKFYYGDEEKHELYISSKDGEVQQFTTGRDRFWAWIGAIPHKFYVPALRQYTDLWINTLTVAGFIGMLCCVFGLILGISIWNKQVNRTSLFKSPFRKKWYKWHYVTGLVFGLFLITWAFSGAMAMQRIPQWIIKTYGDYRVSEKALRGAGVPLSEYKLDYRGLINSYEDVKEIRLTHFNELPIYDITTSDSVFSVDASGPMIKKLHITEETIRKSMLRLYGEETPLQITLIDEYEEYYMSRRRKLPLPVYKVKINNKDKSRFYIDPANGNFTYLNRSRMAKKWIFNGLHYFHIKWIYEKPFLWTFLIWFLCLGGIALSLTGVVLSYKYARRKKEGKRKYKEIK